MAPSATLEITVPVVSKVGEVTEEKHVHGGEGKTPLEAISHGPLIQPGEWGWYSFVNFCSWPVLFSCFDRGARGGEGRRDKG